MMTNDDNNKCTIVGKPWTRNRSETVKEANDAEAEKFQPRKAKDRLVRERCGKMAGGR